jgi:hypothetical protein
MYENARLFFSLLWLAAVGATLASALAVLVSWGDHFEFLIGSVITLGVATAGAVITSL